MSDLQSGAKGSTRRSARKATADNSSSAQATREAIRICRGASPWDARRFRALMCDGRIRPGCRHAGEFLKGHSYEGVSTTGWYVDGIVHRPGMGPFTAVVRGEHMVDYAAPAPRDAHGPSV